MAQVSTSLTPEQIEMVKKYQDKKQIDSFSKTISVIIKEFFKTKK